MTDAAGGTWKLHETKRRMADLLRNGSLSQEVISAVAVNGACAPIECEIFDYKEMIDDSALGIGKLVLQVTSFYNTYGGYLLFGVKESVAEVDFQVVGTADIEIDRESLKAKLKESTGERIQIAGGKFVADSKDGGPCNVFLLYIPKRPEESRPTHFLKDGPGDPSNHNRPVFRRHDTYFRSGDECIEAKGPKLFELAGQRPSPYQSGDLAPAYLALASHRLPNNLPDRAFICPKFVGRVQILDELWRWLADDLSHIKMLAGEGGLGKSSIAFEFAERLSITPNVPFEQIVWVTAKRNQFVGMDDRYLDVPETHYESYESLLRALILRLPITSDEVGDDFDVEVFRRSLRHGLANYPSFVVIDDIDSLGSEDQKKVIELGLILGGTQSRLLLTTRHNLAFSHDTAIEISGFPPDEYRSYLSSLRDRGLLTRNLSDGELLVLYELTQGSPLFTESVCRLLRFQTFENAKKDWEGAKGGRVRAAALDREIQMLSPEAKRVLVAIANMREASIPEIGQVTEYPEQDVQEAIMQLSSLFLVGAEAIAEVPRFRVPNNTSKLVLERQESLVPNVRQLQERITKLREGVRPTKGNDYRVANAISQAQALERCGDRVTALATIEAAQHKIKANADLLGFKAEILMRFDPPREDDARRNAAEAYAKGSRRPGLFLAWFEAEFRAKHFVGAEEAARAALEHGCRPRSDWYARLALAVVFKGEARGLSAGNDSSIAVLVDASRSLCEAIGASGPEEGNKWTGALFDVHDRLWQLVAANLRHPDGMETAIRQLEHMWKVGDHQHKIAKRAIRVVEAMCDYLDSPLREVSPRVLEHLQKLLGRCQNLVVARRTAFPKDTRVGEMDKAWADVSAKFDELARQ